MEPLLEILLTAQYAKELPRQGLFQVGYKRAEADSVAAHSFSVALVAYLLARKLSKTRTVDVARVLELAVLHDCGEFVTGDVNFFVKRFARGALAPVERRAFSSLFSRFSFSGDLDACYDEFEAQETLEARIVKVADALDAIALAALTPSANYPHADFYLFKKMRQIRFEKMRAKDPGLAQLFWDASEALFSHKVRPYLRFEE